MELNNTNLIPAENEETVMAWGETCIDCRWFNASTSECWYYKKNTWGEPVDTSPSRPKCENYMAG